MNALSQQGKDGAGRLRVWRALLGLGLLLWPVAVCAALRFDCLRPVLCVLAALFVLRALMLRGKGGALGAGGFVIAVAGAAACALTLFSDRRDPMLWYPVAVNVIMLATFGISLVFPPSAVTRIAALGGEFLTERVVAYTTGVTKIWCGFFVLNGSVAAFTVLWGDLGMWMWWNGCLSYVAIGALMTGEYLVRLLLKRREASSKNYKDQR